MDAFARRVVKEIGCVLLYAVGFCFVMAPAAAVALLVQGHPSAGHSADVGLMGEMAGGWLVDWGYAFYPFWRLAVWLQQRGPRPYPWIG